MQDTQLSLKDICRTKYYTHNIRAEITYGMCIIILRELLCVSFNACADHLRHLYNYSLAPRTRLGTLVHACHSTHEQITYRMRHSGARDIYACHLRLAQITYRMRACMRDCGTGLFFAGRPCRMWDGWQVWAP